MVNRFKRLFSKNSKTEPSDSAKKMSNKDYEQLGRRMEQVYTSGYASKGRLFYMSFVKGIGYGLGIFIGGTIVVGVVISLLTQFEEVPVLGQLAQKINASIQETNDTCNEIIQQKNNTTNN